MRFTLPFLVLLGCQIAAAAEPPPALATNSVIVQNHGTLGWVAPAGWEYTPPVVDATGQSPVAFRLRAPGGQPTLVFLVFWDDFGPRKLSPTDPQLAALVKSGGELEYAADSVEKEGVQSTFKNDHIHGSYASFTDIKFVGKQAKDVPAEESRVATVGTFRAGQLWGKFTLLTDAKDGPSFDPALAVVKSLRAEAEKLK